VSFSGLTGLAAADGGTKSFSVRATFNASVTDNQQVQFTVTSATADAGGSTFAAGNAGGAASDTTGDANRIEVTASKLVFSTAPPSSVAVGGSFSATVQAQDANGNADLDSTASVTVSKATGTGSLSGGGAQSLVAGEKQFGSLSYDTGEVFTIQAVDNGAGLSAATSGSITATIAGSSSLVIAEVYGGGGNSGSTYKNDFIVVFNRGSSAVDVNGWSVQYAAASGTSWQVTPLASTSKLIPVGGYFLVQEAAGSGGTTELPAPDAIGTISISSTAGKIALANSTTALTGSCPTGGSIVDFAGIGNADCYEGTAAAPAMSNTKSVVRASNGCADTDVNSSDFSQSSGIPTPRNSATAINCCHGMPPTAYAVTGGGVYCLGGSGVAVGLSDSETGVNYQLYRDAGATAVGAPVAGTGDAISFGDQAAADTYTVVATANPGGCSASMTGSATVTVNALPAASDAAYTRGPGASLKIKIADLTPDTIQSLGPASHGTVSQDGTHILYLPSAGDNNNDSFTYTAVNTSACTKQATITVTVVPATGQAQTPTVPPSGPVTVGFAGIPNYPYQAQRATDLDFTTGLRTWMTNAPGRGCFRSRMISAIWARGLPPRGIG